MSGLGLGFRGRRCWGQVRPVCVDEGVFRFGASLLVVRRTVIDVFLQHLTSRLLQFVVRCFFALWPERLGYSSECSHESLFDLRDLNQAYFIPGLNKGGTLNPKPSTNLSLGISQHFAPDSPLP